MNNRIIAIGDIHGCFNLLSKLINKLEHKYRLSKNDIVVFLGDYIDRGNKSFEVIEYLINFKKKYNNTIFLKGNHEQMFLNYLREISQEDIGLFLYNGGRKTLDSYKENEWFVEATLELPPDHLKFYQSLKLFYETKKYFFVHAGKNPYFENDEQSYLWIRDLFINSETDFGKLIIFGHTPNTNPIIRKNKIGIDTGAFYYGRLTSIILPEKIFVSVTND